MSGDLNSVIDATINELIDRRQLTTAEQRAIMTGFDNQFAEVYDVLNHTVEDHRLAALAVAITGYVVGKNLPDLLDRRSDIYDEVICKSTTIVLDMGKSINQTPRSRQSGRFGSPPPRGRVNDSRSQVGNFSRGTGALFTTNARRDTPTNLQPDNSLFGGNTPMFDKGNYTPPANNAPSTPVVEVAPVTVKTTPSDTLRNIHASIPLVDTEPVVASYKTNAGVGAYELSSNTHQLGVVSSYLNYGEYKLVPWYQEEHVPWGKELPDTDTFLKVEELLSGLKSVSSLEGLIKIMSTLIEYGRGPIVSWLSVRLGTDAVTFMERNFSITQYESLPFFTQTEKVTEILRELNIFEAVVTRILYLTRKLFSSWHLKTLPPPQNESGYPKYEVCSVIVLSYTKPLLVIPVSLKYLKHACTLQVLIKDDSLTNDLINPLIQAVFERLPDKDEDELLIIDNVLTMYSTNRLCTNTPLVDILYAVNKLNV